MKTENVVMSSTIKGICNFNVIPTKDTVDYDTIYNYNFDPGFSFFNGNRLVIPSHVKQLKKDIIEGKYGSKYFAPIRVDINTMKVSDGQNRYVAFKELFSDGSPEILRVQFEDYPAEKAEKLNVICHINCGIKSWTVGDYEYRQIQEGNKNMISIKEFATSHPILCKRNKAGEIKGYYPRYAYAVILGRNATKEVKDGTISVSKKDLEFAEQMYSELEQLVRALGYEIGNWFESFTHAWYSIRKNDKANSEIVDTLGIDLISKHIYDQFKGWHPMTRRTEWENRFRTAIWNIKRAKDNKEI